MARNTLLAIVVVALVSICITMPSCMLRHPLMKSGKTYFAADSTVIPFTEQFGSIVLDVRVNNRPSRLVFDTGAATTVMGEALAEELGVETKFLAKTEDANKQEGDLHVGLMETLQIADLTYRDYPVLVVPLLGDSGECLCIYGIFGAHMMRNAVWKVDFQNRLLTSYRESLPAAQLADFIAIPFTPDELGVPYIEIDVAGRTLKVLVDLGSNHGIDLDAATVANLPADQVREVVEGAGSSLALFGREPRPFHMIEVSQVRIGSLVLDQPLCRQREQVSSKIGLGFFRHHELVIDWSRQMLYLKPTGSTIYSSVFSQVSLGLEDGAVVVSSLARYDPEINLQLGDRIVAVDGKPVDPTNQSSVCQLLEEIAGSRNRVFKFTYDRPGGERGLQQNVRARVYLR